ncbi:DUF6443 domain-containing protein [Zunongwangia sp.]|uniref:DUF6443 domain-containing protein n=1 Tax=Zunongwangia sp. TaxID=1965325 RepID=UPI003AA8EDD8
MKKIIFLLVLMFVKFSYSQIYSGYQLVKIGTTVADVEKYSEGHPYPTPDYFPNQGSPYTLTNYIDTYGEEMRAGYIYNIKVNGKNNFYGVREKMKPSQGYVHIRPTSIEFISSVNGLVNEFDKYIKLYKVKIIGENLDKINEYCENVELGTVKYLNICSKSSLKEGTIYNFEIKGENLFYLIDSSPLAKDSEYPLLEYSNFEKIQTLEDICNKGLQGEVKLTQTENYIQTIKFLEPISNTSEIKEYTKKTETVNYFDALGRLKQSISVRGGANYEDVITPFQYDKLGRQKKEYLPYADKRATKGKYHNNAFEEQKQFYESDKYENTKNPYSEKVFESSPRNLILEKALPGNAWDLSNENHHSEKKDYHLVNYRDKVKYYSVSYESSTDKNKPVLLDNGYLMKNKDQRPQLFKFTTRGENYREGDEKSYDTEVFIDFQNRKLLERRFVTNSKTNHLDQIDTYYVYDDYGNLVYVLPPQSNPESKITQEILDKFCYQYKYDTKNRLIEKKIPGKGLEYIVYNKIGQPIMTQDKELRKKNQWLFTKYDRLGRKIYTGFFNSTLSINQHQELADKHLQTFESRLKNQEKANTINSTEIYYTNKSYPKVNTGKILSINYFDTYLPNNSIYFEKLPISNNKGKKITLEVKGLSTVSQVRVLTQNSEKWITSTFGYDNYARTIWSNTNNQYLQSTLTTTNSLDFSGKILESTSQHEKRDIADSKIILTDFYDYDHVGRLKTHTQSLNGDIEKQDLIINSLINKDSSVISNHSILLKPGFHFKAKDGVSFKASIIKNQTKINYKELIASNFYDELGNLITKKVGGSSVLEGLQQINYKYTVNGWLKSINNVDNLDKDLFAFKLNYNSTEMGLSLPLYNGNISESIWKSALSDNKKRGYSYSYDELNRIKSAQFRSSSVNSNHSFTEDVANYDVSGIEYDKNGNILSLKRSGFISTGNYNVIDDLTYEYDGNRLVKVNDKSEILKGFKGSSNNAIDYAYDGNGNMTQDLNKNIQENGITYNHLNLPEKIRVGSGESKKIEYVYDATGTKLAKKVTENGTTIKTEYAGNFIYKGGNFEFFSTSEGYVSKENGQYQYVYQYKDVWDNVRVSYSDTDGNGSIETSSEILRERNYYPFGMFHSGYNDFVVGTENNHKTYQGQEFTDDLGLNIHEWKYRFSDPTIGGRFWSIDPLAEDYSYQSPYNFSENDPVSGVELEGLEKLRVTVYNVLKNHSGGYTKSIPQMTSVTDNHDWNDGTHNESQFNVYDDENKMVKAIYGGPEANFNLSKAGINITKVERVDLSIGEVFDAVSNNTEFQRAGETTKNYFAGVGLAFGVGAIAAGEGTFFTYLGLVSDADVVAGGENGSLTDYLNENGQKSATLVGTASAVGSKTEAVKTLRSTAATTSSKSSAAINLFKAIFDLSAIIIEKININEEGHDGRL